MAKELKIDGRMKVKALKEQCKDVFGGTLRVYDGNKFADDDLSRTHVTQLCCFR